MHNLAYLPSIILLLGCSIFIVVSMQKLQLSPVLGYLVFGALIAHYNIINDDEATRSFADFGVVFLLFIIGLELTFERLIRMRLHVFGFGGLQILLTTVIMAPIFIEFFNLDTILSIVIASAISLSSTAIVMQVLTESKRQSSQIGRLSLSVLLMQDLAVVPLLAVLPMIVAGGDRILSTIGEAGLRAIAIIVVITVSGRLLLRPLLKLIGSVNKEEIYVNVGLFILLGAAWITSEQGLSAAMGAFLAGILIAETEYRNRIEESILPFQGLFLGLFFIITGMSIDIGSIISNLQKVLMLAFSIMTMKFLIIFLLCKLFRFGTGAAIHSGLLLCQCSEFAFILFGLANQQKIISDELTKLLLMVVTFTMAITPLLARLGAKIEEILGYTEEIAPNQEFRGVSDLNNHVIISGFGRVGRMVAYILELKQIPYVGIDSNAALVKEARDLGYPVYHGDLASMSTLKAVGIDRASSVVLTMTDKISLQKSTKFISKEFKNIPLIVRVEDFKHAQGMKKLGANAVVLSTTELGLQLGGRVLQTRNIPEHEIILLKNKLRKNEYEVTEDVEMFKGKRRLKNLGDDLPAED